MSKTILITGAASGFGRDTAEHGLGGHLAASGLMVASTFLPGVTATDIRHCLAVVGGIAATMSANLTHRSLL